MCNEWDIATSEPIIALNTLGQPLFPESRRVLGLTAACEFRARPGLTQTSTAGSRIFTPLANERDVHVHQKVVATLVIERVIAVHKVDDDAGARAPCLRDGFNARRIAEAVVGRESPWAQKRFLGEGVRALLGVVLWDASASTLPKPIMLRKSRGFSRHRGGRGPRGTLLRSAATRPWGWK